MKSDERPIQLTVGTVRKIYIYYQCEYIIEVNGEVFWKCGHNWKS